METKAFHESIIDSINECKERVVFETLCKLVLETKIPKNHQAISDAIMASPLEKKSLNTVRVLRKLSEESKPASDDEEELDDYHKNHFVTGSK